MSLRDIRKHVGQVAIAGFDGLSIPGDFKALAREFDLGGVILFARNVESPEQVAELSREARSLARELPLSRKVAALPVSRRPSHCGRRC
jgi:beta-N-acetylhexosaminidase